MKSVDALRKWADGLSGIWIDPNDHTITITTGWDAPPDMDSVSLRDHVNSILDGIDREVKELTDERDLTPAQAIDATLGQGTCHAIEVPMGIHDDATATVCSACRVAIDELSEMNYCPNCGRAVVE